MIAESVFNLLSVSANLLTDHLLYSAGGGVSPGAAPIAGAGAYWNSSTRVN